MAFMVLCQTIALKGEREFNLTRATQTSVLLQMLQEWFYCKFS